MNDSLKPILMGKAEELPKHIRNAVQKVLRRPGFYIATDVNQPGAECLLVSIDGEIYSTKLDTLLPPDRFLKTVKFHGPFRAKQKHAQANYENRG